MLTHEEWKVYSDTWKNICDLFNDLRFDENGKCNLRPDAFAKLIVDRFGASAVAETFALVIYAKPTDGRIYPRVREFFEKYIPQQVKEMLAENKWCIHEHMYYLDDMHSTHINQTALELIKCLEEVSV